MELSLGMHTHNFGCADSLKQTKYFDILKTFHSLFFLFSLSPTYSSFHPMSLKLLIAGHAKNQQWRMRLRRPAAAVIETVMRRGSAYTGRVKDSSTHTREGERWQSRCVDEEKVSSDGEQERESEGGRVWSRQEMADSGVYGSRSLPGKALK